MTRRAAAWTLCLALGPALLAQAAADTNCDVHAAAMVAEMRASAAKPMSDADIALVRETARKSCLAQSGATADAATSAPATVAAATRPATAAAPAAAKSDTSFWGALNGFIGGPTTRKPGNKRLLERSGQ